MYNTELATLVARSPLCNCQLSHSFPYACVFLLHIANPIAQYMNQLSELRAFISWSKTQTGKNPCHELAPAHRIAVMCEGNLMHDRRWFEGMTRSRCVFLCIYVIVGLRSEFLFTVPTLAVWAFFFLYTVIEMSLE